MKLLTVPFCSHAGKPNFPQTLEKNGGDDETRTRDLCRGRVGTTSTSNNFQGCWGAAKYLKIPTKRKHFGLDIGLKKAILSHP